MVTKEQLKTALNFQEYLDFTQHIIDNKTPAAPYDDSKMMQYAIDNLARMKHVLDTISIEKKLYNHLSNLQKKLVWVILTEPWCGDAAQTVPALAAFANISPNISFKILLRDSNLEVMDMYLTNGGRSIPKLVCIDKEKWQELGTWGPRPQTLQQRVLAQKENTELSFGEKVRQIQAWYEENKTHDLQLEFIDLLKQWNEVK